MSRARWSAANEAGSGEVEVESVERGKVRAGMEEHPLVELIHGCFMTGDAVALYLATHGE